MVLDGRIDDIEVAFAQDATMDEDDDGVFNEIPTSIVDFMEFYLLNYFKPATGEQSGEQRARAETCSARSAATTATCPT